MLVDERRNSILLAVEEKGFVSLHDLADLVQASESTIRRDLEYLDASQQIRRTRGGAAYVGESITSFEERVSKASLEKQKIAEAAANLIDPGEAILLDGGTTTLVVARYLVNKPLQVVTNSLPIMNLLVNQPLIELMILGGYLYPKTGVALGPQATASLENIHVRRLIISVGGITQKGLFNSNALLVSTERAMLTSADEIMVVADSSKFGKSALVPLCELDMIDHMVVDSGITEEWIDVLKRANIELTIVDVHQK
ncbi:MAG: DeoR/GlpR family DNA-binding transcription regulator [Planctomycetaceae bacterium]